MHLEAIANRKAVTRNNLFQYANEKRDARDFLIYQRALARTALKNAG